MNDNAQKWVDALRSGEFRQGKNVLKTPDGTYCCLGVACELYRQATGDGEWLVDPEANGLHEGFVFRTSHGESQTGLPDAVKTWLGLAPHVSNEGSIDLGKPRGYAEPLTYLNDNREYSFPAIADAIEARQEQGLFAERLTEDDFRARLANE